MNEKMKRKKEDDGSKQSNNMELLMGFSILKLRTTKEKHYQDNQPEDREQRKNLCRHLLFLRLQKVVTDLYS